jgi:hypothetical protein
LYRGSCIFAKSKKEKLIPLFIEYLSAAKKLPLQGVGALGVKRIAAQLDISERQVISPATSLEFISEVADPGTGEFVAWLASKLGVEISQAELQYHQFINGWISSLQQQKNVSWKGVGGWQINENQSISFTPEMSPAFEGLPVRAEKLIRENSSHQVRVGEEHRSSEEMTALLTAKTKTVSMDWWLGVSALVLLVAFWSFYFFQYSLTPATIANPRKAVESVIVNK